MDLLERIVSDRNTKYFSLFGLLYSAFVVALGLTQGEAVIVIVGMWGIPAFFGMYLMVKE